MINGELIVDNFAGGGGASTGIEIATGKSVDIAINHDPEAIRMHRANHPHTKHYCENVWEVDPVKACKGHPVGLAWFSPDCKHFSKAKGGKPVEKNIRGLAWVVLKWAALVRPRVIMLGLLDNRYILYDYIPGATYSGYRDYFSIKIYDKTTGETKTYNNVTSVSLGSSFKLDNNSDQMITISK